MPIRPFRLDNSPEGAPEGGGLAVLEPADPTSGGSNYRAIIYNDDHHGMDEVVEQLIKATECDMDKAINVMLEAHKKGRAVCFRGNRDKCQQVVKVLREISLQCEVDCD